MPEASDLEPRSTWTSIVIFISFSFRRSNFPDAGPNIGRRFDAKINIFNIYYVIRLKMVGLLRHNGCYDVIMGKSQKFNQKYYRDS